MDPSTLIILFIFGIAIGSFLNVVASRYDGDHFLLSDKLIGGRSHCTHCKKTLRWFELIPLFSFIVQGGRCLRCKARLSMQYPAIELLSGLIFVFVPLQIAANGSALISFSGLWIAVFEALLVMSIVDIRLGIIPDELNIFLGAVGVALAALSFGYDGAMNHSMLGPFAGFFGVQGNVIINRVTGALFGAAFFGLLIVLTRGRGMGMGDLKLAVPLGLIFGWPDVIFAFAFAFVFGATVGLISIARHKTTMKGTLPFGPFLALGAVTMFFWGAPLFNWYLSSLGVR